MDFSNFLASGKVILLPSSFIKGYVRLHLKHSNPVTVLLLILVLCLASGFSWIGQYGSCC